MSGGMDNDRFNDDHPRVVKDGALGPSVDDVNQLLAEECDAIKALLLKKNKAYGNSALNPVRIFSKADPIEQIKVRIDDKLSRLARGTSTDAVPEDTEQDLLGYFMLLRVARRLAKESSK